MRPWFRRRRREPVPALAPAPPVERVPEASATPAVELEPEPPVAAVDAEAPPAEPEGDISPVRLDEALQRLRRDVPARDDGPTPA